MEYGISSITCLQGKNYFDEITPLDIQLFIKYLDQKGDKEATIRDAVAGVKKVFNWLIEDVEVLNFKNPVKKKIQFPKKGGVVRDRILTEYEFRNLLFANETQVTHSSNWSPTKELVKFLAFIGARIGEALHAEIDDFDLKNGIWHIRNKQKCPTANGLGWSPKWHKERSIPLFPEALEIVNSLEYIGTVGLIPIRDENGKIIDHKKYPAKFIFPNKVIRVLPNCPMKIEKGYFKCCKCKDAKNRDKCKFRTVTYTRLDSIDGSWGTL